MCPRSSDPVYIVSYHITTSLLLGHKVDNYENTNKTEWADVRIRFMAKNQNRGTEPHIEGDF